MDNYQKNTLSFGTVQCGGSDRGVKSATVFTFFEGLPNPQQLNFILKVYLLNVAVRVL